MAELNDAYAQLRTADRRAVYDRLGQPARPSHTEERAQAQDRPVGARHDSGGKGMLDFGRYVGWSVADLAGHDPDYLRWLSRHSSGIRHRHEIAELLDGVARSTADAAAAKKRERRLAG